MGVDIENAQLLLDSGYSKNKTAKLLEVHHMTISRLVEKGVLEVYEPNCEQKDDQHLYQNFEWLWEEDKLEEMCYKAFDDDYVLLNDLLEDNFYSVGKYVKEKYGTIYKYLIIKGFYRLRDSIYKNCSKCNKSKKIKDFSKRRWSLPFGLESQCKGCVQKRFKKYYNENEEYRENCKASGRKWRQENQERFRESVYIAYHKRRAIEKKLPADFNINDYRELYKVFKGCGLTGSQDLHLGHVIPLSTGRVGTLKGNMMLLKSELNLSKNNQNIFEWFKTNRQRFELTQEKFDAVIEYLAQQNEMTPIEYRNYVYWCHDNPRTIEELKELIN
ncbi:hypothetical protein V1503_06160 [Bacillus sp. SCS-151]|uniref:hypothetical protein n=1 Tax=Nanhaiella sioensis TaxID=3115293 RepID=UPI00397949CC